MAQQVAELIFRNFPPECFVDDDNVELGTLVVEQFLPYTQRHYARINRLAQEAAFIDYVYSNMKLDDIDQTDAAAVSAVETNK